MPNNLSWRRWRFIPFELVTDFLHHPKAEHAVGMSASKARSFILWNSLIGSNFLRGPRHTISTRPSGRLSLHYSKAHLFKRWLQPVSPKSAKSKKQRKFC